MIAAPIELVELPAVAIAADSTTWTFLQPGETWEQFPEDRRRILRVRTNLN